MLGRKPGSGSGSEPLLAGGGSSNRVQVPTALPSPPSHQIQSANLVPHAPAPIILNAHYASLHFTPQALVADLDMCVPSPLSFSTPAAKKTTIIYLPLLTFSLLLRFCHPLSPAATSSTRVLRCKLLCRQAAVNSDHSHTNANTSLYL